MGTAKGAETKRRIVHTAAEVFARNGYHATGMSELESAVNLQRGALYYHIGSKEELLYEISIRHVQVLVAFAEDLVAQDLPAEAKLRRLSRQLMHDIAENLAEVTVFFRELGSLSSEHSATIRELRDRYEQTWASVLQQGEADGTLNPGLKVDIKAILGMHNYSYLWLDTAGDLDPEEIADRFCDILLYGLAAVPRPGA